MLNFTRIIFIFGLLAATCFIFTYMKDNTTYHEGPLQKAKNLLLYGYLKACITWEFGKHYISLALSSIFSSYHAGEDHMKEIEQRQHQMLQLKNHMNISSNCCNEKGSYNLKILK